MQALHPNPASGSSESSSARSLECKIEMVFRFWTPSAKSQDLKHQEAMLNKHPGVLALIEDVVASKHGTFLVGDQQLYVSGLKHPADALVISRQLQLCMQGFRQRQGTEPVAVSIAIDARGKTAVPANPEADGNGTAGATFILRDNTAGPSYDLVTLLQLSKPAQILVTHDLCDQIRGLKWLPLKSFPDRFGVFEYLWAAEEKLEQFQSEAQFKLPELLPSLPPEPERSETTPEEGTFVGRHAGAGQTPLEQESILARLLSVIRANRMIAIGSLALVFLIAVGLVGVRMASKPAHHQPAAPVGTVPPPIPTATQPDPKPITATSSSVTLPPKTVLTPARSKDKALTGSGETSPGLGTTTTERPSNVDKTDDKTASKGCDLLPASLAAYLAIAEDKRGRADYPGAERIFRQVLRCEPTNAAARSGLERTLAAEGETR
jgi:hypothetical protein